MVNFNSVLLIGRLTSDPEVRMIPDGTPVCSFRLAVNERYKRRDGEPGESVCFVQIEAWRALADICSKYLTRGREVFVLGKLRHSQWTTAEGQKRSRLTVTARTVQFMGGRRKAEGSGSEAAPEPDAAEPEAEREEEGSAAF